MPKRVLRLRPWRRHSAVLAVAGIIYILYGIAIAAVEPNNARARSLAFSIDIMPLPAWGVIWCAVGALALASTRWPPQSETWGYAAMSGLAAFWSASYALNAIFMGDTQVGVTASLVWAMCAFLWWAISGLTNPDDVRTEPNEPHWLPPDDREGA